MGIGFILMVIAFVLFILAAVGVPSGRVSFLPLGLAMWILALLIGAPHT